MCTSLQPSFATTHPKKHVLLCNSCKNYSNLEEHSKCKLMILLMQIKAASVIMVISLCFVRANRNHQRRQSFVNKIVSVVCARVNYNKWSVINSTPIGKCKWNCYIATDISFKVCVAEEHAHTFKIEGYDRRKIFKKRAIRLQEIYYYFLCAVDKETDIICLCLTLT